MSGFITIFIKVLGLSKKFSGDEPIFTQFLTKISSIKEVVSIYEIPKKRLKSKENLIFEY